ncbi:MAG TPA: AcrB/AcrD/AcrF family protein [Rhodopirellula baltica]|uniref:Probable multidrug resistance protein n=1 Tax=Rhodopirellula baltica (strain DSM 10527 / NCIMB 13988 / SH1) TaxID=243090 RepID=Q7UJP2_RHOBA|nr:efflux RND transporter permease subunit [Rhodopirellula baltica]CAD77190.1 probable multidrug resistance protein [Rhodopirellula baltica SH 1]HBE64195.1 AcrB/AcrD/AcrF family protein [Rhodopirellula baltica]
MTSLSKMVPEGGPIAWMARNSIAANLLMLLLLGGGIWSAFAIQKEVFPQFQLDIVEVAVGYPGAAPEEVEQGILRPIEEAVRGVEGIREVTSEAREGRGELLIELVGGEDRMKVLQDVDQAVSRIRTFPDQIEQPEVRLQSRQQEVMQVAIYGPIDVWALRKLAEQLRDQLQSKEQITQVELRRVPAYVTHVEIPRQRLREYGLTLPDVAEIIRTSSQDVAAGSVQTTAGEILLRVKARKQWAEEFAGIEIVAGRDGPMVTLGDIATIRDGFEEVGFHSQFSQTPSVELDIYRVGSQSPMDVAEAVQETMEEFETALPPGVKWRIDSNNAEEFRRRLMLVAENAAMAVVIVLVILSLFLEFRLAFWVMMGMAVSFIGGVLLLPAAGVSINMISLFGFLVVLGIVVDDAVVVGENVYEKRQTLKDHEAAAVEGTKEVSGPVTFSILTNIVAFVPLLFIPGETGKFWGPLPVVVIIVLALSLVESLFILPAHLAHARDAGRDPNSIGARLHHLQQRFSQGFNRLVEFFYRPVLILSLRHRYVTASLALALFVVIGGYATSAHMGLILMPEVSADEIEAGVRMPVGTTQAQAAKIADTVTKASIKMFEEHNLYEVAEGIKTNVRGQSFIDVEIVMKPPDQRDMTANEVIDLWREHIGDLPGVNQVTFEAERGPGGHRRDISIDLSHSDIDVLEQAATAFVDRVKLYSNARDVNDNYNKGKTQYDFRLRPEGRSLGLTDEELGEQLRGAFFGSLALRLIRGTNETEVRVKLPEEQREDIHSLEDLIIRTPSGAEVPLLDVAEVEETLAFRSINRRDGRRTISVSMDVEPKRAATQVIEALQNSELPKLREDFPGITWSFEGSDAEMRQATASLWGSFGLALAVIYSLLAIAFKGYVQPLIVLVAIPFGVVGAIIGHIMLGYDLSLVSLMGVIALSGVVINDSLIMIDYANRHRKNQSAFDAISQAGLRRFRPILLTTLTTFGGLMPLIFEDSLQAQYIIPMAISLGFGILFATAIILVLVPCLYLILEDIQKTFTPDTE